MAEWIVVSCGSGRGSTMHEKTVAVAKMQRLMLLAILGMIGAIVLAGVGGATELGVLVLVAQVCYLAGVVTGMVSLILLMRALEMSVLLIVVCAILLLIPLIGLITLLIINGRATGYLRAQGLHVGLLGAKV
jgi:hypothetical protein